MSSQSYWEKRKAQEMFEYMTEAEQAADEISKAYHKASRYISLELDQIFERFQTKHGLTEEKARAMLNTIQDAASLEEWKSALKSGTGDESKEELLALLESPAYQARLEHLQQMQNQIDMTMKQVYKQEKDFSTSFYTDLANEAYYKSIFSIQQRTGLGFGFDLLSPKTIDMVLHSKWSGENYSSRIWKNTGALARDLKEELLINLMTGRTDREVADIIANKFAQGASNARRLVRTESCNLSNQMEMKSYEECGIETYIFVATLDLRTSSQCRGLDRKRYKVSEQQPGVNCPPIHPWCRSTTICDISDAELAQMERRARDPVTGKTKMVPANMSYQEWYDKNVKDHPDAMLNETMWKNRHGDKKQYEKYKKILGKDVPKDMESFQKMKYTDSKTWDELKQEYRIVNQYQVVSGEVPTKKIVELHKKNMDFRNNFQAGVGKRGNAATLDFNGATYHSNSSIQNTKSKGYLKYKGDTDKLILLKLKEQRVFKTSAERSTNPPYRKWDRCIDSEAKIMEFMHDNNERTKSIQAYMISDYPMCDSCKSVLEQFKQRDANIKLNIIERRKT